MAPRATVPLREIIYTLSPYNQEIVMQGVANYPGKIAKFFKNVSVYSILIISMNQIHPYAQPG
jgi:hypothetical protein